MTDTWEMTPGGTTKPHSVESFLLSCAGAFQRQIPPLLDALFDKLDDALYDLADKAGNDRLHARYFDAMRMFRKQGRNIKTTFLQHLQEATERTVGREIAPEPPALDSYFDGLRMEDFSLVEEADLEESLAVGNLVSKAENRYHHQLYELGRCLGQLLGRPELPPRSNPLGPVAMCEAFGAALKPMHEVDLAIKLVVYKLFDKHVMDDLGGIYDQCLRLAATQGLTADLTPRRPTAGAPAARLPARREASAPQRGRAPEAAMAVIVGPVPFDQLRSLLDQWRPARASAAADQPGDAVVVPTSELMAILSGLQDAARAGRSGQLAPIDVQRRLRDALRAECSEEAARSRSLGDVDEDTLELVLILFESIVQGGDLADPIKALVGRLQIPLVKAALLDKTFFDNPEHPARRLLNRIADAAVGWSESEERTPDSLYGRIEGIIERVIGEFDRDLSLFDRLDAELIAYLAEETPRIREVEAAVCSVAADRDRTAGARRRAEATVERHLRRDPLTPPVVQSVLREGWTEVLYAAYLSGDAGSREWREAVAFMDQLMWSVRPKVTPDDRRALLQRVPELLRTLRGGLTGVDLDQRILARWFKELQALHLTALRGTDRPLAAVGPAVPSAPATPRHATTGRGAHPMGTAGGTGNRQAGPAEPADLAQQLVPGCWVELVRDDSQRVRVKLAWVSTDGERLQFVDRQGREGPQLGRDDLVTLLQYGLASIVRGQDDLPLVDRALATVARTLTN